jgi:hypothetical protein
MSSSTILKNVSTHLFDGFTSLNNSIDTLSNERVPKIRSSLSNLNPSSPMYELQKKGVDTLVKSYRNDLDNMSNIIFSSAEALNKASTGIKVLKGQVREMERQHDWTVAGRFGRIYVTVKHTAIDILELGMTPINLLRENPNAQVATALFLTASAGFGAGYLAARA